MIHRHQSQFIFIINIQNPILRNLVAINKNHEK
jgi:hypothetical protein